MKKGLMLLFILGLTLGLAACQSNSTEKTETEKMTGTQEEIAKAYIEVLAAGDYDRLANGFAYDAEMEKLSGKLESIFASSMAALGELKEIQTPLKIEQGEYTVQSVPTVFENQKTNINLVFNQEGAIAGVNFSEYIEPSEEAALTLPEGTEEIELSMIVRDGKEIPGTLTLPQSADPVPLVLLVHGSGPSDRNETIYANTVFKDLAWLLAKEGIATFRYDKRTYLYGEEMADDTQATVYEETINDAADIFNALQAQDKIDPNQIYILGHSLGALCIPRIAKEANAAGYIMMAAPVSDLASIMRQQYEFLSQFASAQEKAQFDSALKELDKLDDLDSLAADEAVLGAYPAYWKDLLEYDPIEAAAEIQTPVLVLQGEEDYQVPLEEYERWKEAYGDSSNWEFHSYSGLSHLFMPGSLSEAPTAYYLRKATVDQRVIDDIAAFVKKYGEAISQ